VEAASASVPAFPAPAPSVMPHFLCAVTQDSNSEFPLARWGRPFPAYIPSNYSGCTSAPRNPRQHSRRSARHTRLSSATHIEGISFAQASVVVALVQGRLTQLSIPPGCPPFLRAVRDDSLAIGSQTNRCQSIHPPPSLPSNLLHPPAMAGTVGQVVYARCGLRKG
jgi:hypothetical protein